jgi:hypothetical protein
VRRVLAALLALAAMLAAAAPAAAVIPGNSGPIAFSPSPQGEFPQVFLVNPDGSFLSQVTAAPYGATRPVWFPDGRRIGYARGEGDEFLSTPAVLDVATGETRPPRDADLISSNMFAHGNNPRIAWSPDGSRIAYDTETTGPPRIKIATRGGTTDLTVGSQPDWSPTGTQLAFVRDAGIYTINADGTGETQLVAPSPGTLTGYHNPAWSPDGTRIAFLTITQSYSNQIEVMNADGSGRTVIATGPLGRLAWSPDGSRIAFVRGVPNGSLWTINPDGSAPALVTNNALYFSWGTGPLLTRRLLPPPDATAVNASVVRGRVLIKRRGAPRFTALRGDARVPYGSQLDTRRGRVRIVAEAGDGRLATGEFYAGVFRLVRRKGAVTELRLGGSSFRRCRNAGGTARAAQLSRRTIRRLKANARGRFRTRGRHSAATVRGTVWTTADRCDGTLTTVKRGKVAVRDFARRRTVVVRAGRRYLARARR